MIIIPIIYLVIIMKLKNSIIISLLTMFLGFIPMYQKDNDIRYEISAESISIANKIKEEMIMFYKEHSSTTCFSSSVEASSIAFVWLCFKSRWRR